MSEFVINREEPMTEEEKEELMEIVKETYYRLKKFAEKLVKNREAFKNQPEDVKKANIVSAIIRTTMELSYQIVSGLAVELTYNYVNLYSCLKNAPILMIIGGEDLDEVQKNN